MATISKRDSQDLLLDGPVELKRGKSADAVVPSVRRWRELVAAWGEGRFNASETIVAAKEEFFSKNLKYDVGTANGHMGVAALKTYTFDTIDDWFIGYLSAFDFTEVTVAAASPGDAHQLWQQMSATVTSKASGRSALLEMLIFYELEELSTAAKFCRVTIVYADPAVAAYLTGVTAMTPERVVPLSFEPHLDPMTVWRAALDAWGAGEFARAEAKHTAMDKLVHPQCVIDASSAALPAPFGVFHGHTGCDEWNNEVIGKWEFTNLDLSAEAGLKPGYVLHRAHCDVKLGSREAKGVLIFVDSAYDVDGKCVYSKIYWANPRVVASLYETDGE